MLVNDFENMAVECLLITEKWIRQKVNLQHNCLADVRSLCLPGTYEGKIRHLGNSLKNFTRLKTLDLSYNALESVEGIQHLKMLEVLNLYYNKIPSFKDILVLCQLKALRELDLRLNPVVRNSPDYRLYLVHTLSNLRRLDDCPVRDSERRAALLHFSSDVMFESQPAVLFPSGKKILRSSQPRMAHVNRILKKRSFLDDNDEAVLNLVAKSSLDLLESADLKSSTSKEPECQLYGLEEEMDNVQKYSGNETATSLLPSNQDSAKPILRHAQEKDKHQSGVMHLNKDGCMGRRDLGPRVTFVDHVDHLGGRQWQEQNWFQIQQRIPAQSNFTPKPEDPPSPRAPSSCPVKRAIPPQPSCSSSCGSRSQGEFIHLADSQQLPNISPEGTLHVEGTSATEDHSSKQESIFNSNCGKSLALLLELVDKHWNGMGSLQHSHRFLAHAFQILSKLERDALNSEENVRSQKAVTDSLNAQRQREAENHQSEVKNLHSQLDQAQRSVEDLNVQLKDTLEENVSLQKQLIKLEQRLLNSRVDGAAQLNERQSAGLRTEVQELRERLQQTGKLQELADMLQESHRSLVSTNERLLVELQETKARHQAEVEKLYGRFRELKRTVGMAYGASKGKA